MTPLLIVMAKRLDSVLKSNKHINRSKLLALNPFGSKTAIAAENNSAKEPLLTQQTVETLKIENSLIDQGSNIKAEEDFEKESNTIHQDLNDSSEIKNNESNENKSESLNQTEPEIEENKISTSTETQDSKQVDFIQHQEQIDQTNESQHPIINQLTPKENLSQEEKPSGWGIQVGAFKTKDISEQQAKRASRILKIRNKQILTPQTANYYRSRIYGFYSKKAAQNACRKLKQSKIGCLVIPKEN